MVKQKIIPALGVVGLLLAIAAAVFVFRGSSLSLSELEQKAAEIDTLFNVAARKHVDVYFQLSTLYFKHGEYEKSYRAVKKGLALDPVRLRYQLHAAKIEIALKKYRAAAQRIDHILMSKPSLLLRVQCKLLTRKIPETERSAVPVGIRPLFSKKILLWIYPGIERQLVDAITENIQHDYRLSIEQMPSTAPEDAYHARDVFDTLASGVINSLYAARNNTVIDTFLLKMRLPNTALQTKEGRRLFMEHIFLTIGNDPEGWQRFTTNHGLQYDASVLINQISQEYTAAISDKKDILGILALTPHDIYSGSDDNNFLFGLYSGNVAVVSVHRFDHGKDIDSAIIQSLTSVGHLIGIPRCSSPQCVRSYAHSLSEHYQKGTELCNECRENINQRYAHIETAGE